MGRRIFFLHAHPVPHNSHIFLGRQLGLEWGAAMGQPGRRAWVISIRNALRLARRSDWDVLFADTACHEGLVLRLLDPRRRKRVLLDSTNAVDSQFASHRRRGPIGALLRSELRSWDAIIAISDKGERAVRSHLGSNVEVGRWTPAVTFEDPFPGPVSERRGPVIAMMNGGNHYTAWYKGLDRVAEASLRGTAEGWGPVQVFGRWPEAQRLRFTPALRFLGLREAHSVYPGASVLLHLSREEAFGVAIIEAMVAGVPPVVGDAGAAAVVTAVEPRLVVTDVDQAVAVVRWLRDLPDDQYRDLSRRLRQHALRFAEGTRAEAAASEVRAILGGPRRRVRSDRQNCLSRALSR